MGGRREQLVNFVKQCIKEMGERFSHANGQRYNGFSLRSGSCAVHVSDYYDDAIFLVHGDWVARLNLESNLQRAEFRNDQGEFSGDYWYYFKPFGIKGTSFLSKNVEEQKKEFKSFIKECLDLMPRGPTVSRPRP